MGLSFMDGGGEVGAAMRALDWSRTALGPPETWPPALRTSAGICLHSQFPMILWWGADLTVLYNDAYIPMLGHKHPQRALGQPGHEVWAEVWDIIGPMLRRVMQFGEANWADDLLLYIDRQGYAEECYFRFSYSPIRDEHGRIVGVFTPVSETTQKVVGERRLRTLQQLLARCVHAGSAIEACRIATEVLLENSADVPHAATFLLDAGSRTARLVPANVESPLPAACEVTVDLDATESVLADAMRSGDTRVLEKPDPSIVVAVRVPGDSTPTAWIVATLSRARRLDADYRGFFDLVEQQLGSALAAVRSLEEERRRALALAEIDRAKTAFFSNVSHEFRTPLTLLLGPIEDLIHSEGAPELRERLAVVHRNALRLQRLVNSLLEFSRIEAGRIDASYEPLDLAELTAHLAGTFRSAVERAGLAYTVECEPLAAPVYVDREMWEKIVLNLLSNAFKFTLEGGIDVRLRTHDDGALLTVADTGVGVPADALPRLFERFYRVENAGGRTYEGSGIGLALVQELTKMHGGRVEVSSTPEVGSEFRVWLPFGREHLPQEAIGRPRARVPATIGARAYVEEALRWLPEPPAGAREFPAAPEAARDRRFASTFGARVLVVDDNADMRAYVRDLLAPRYRVATARDGEEALAAIAAAQPALVVSDVMMPRLDGLQLLAALRADPRLARTPVVLLTARAGEDARIEGFDAGADDYIIKPFSARELLARVGALLERDLVRRASERRMRENETHLTLALQAAQLGTWSFDVRTGELEASDVMRRLFEMPAGRSIAVEWNARLDPEDRDRVAAEVATAIAGGRGFDAEYRIRVSSGVRWIRARAQPVGDASGSPRLVGVAEDITTRRRSRDALEAENRQKDEFLAMLAHELRNPLAPIRNAGEVLARLLGDDARAQGAVGMLQRQVTQLTRLVDDLLDVSRITRGRIELKRGLVEVHAIVSQAVESIEPLVRERGHALSVDVAPGPIVVDGDHARLVQCLVNLLTNAVKYTEPGGRLAVAARADAGEAVIDVRDSGSGIPPDLLPRIFDLFVQNHRTLDRSQGGLGIGLSVVQRLVELHGGRVTACSDGLGHGSTFEIRLPLATGAVERLEPPAQARAAPQRVLIVDDNVDAANSLALVLQLDRHEVQSVYSAEDALERAPAFEPDVVLLDIGLPGMDGYEVARRLRARLDDVRLIALTGYGQPEDRRRSWEAGFDAHLVKPVELEALGRAIGGGARD